LSKKLNFFALTATNIYLISTQPCLFFSRPHRSENHLEDFPGFQNAMWLVFAAAPDYTDLANGGCDHAVAKFHAQATGS
jgi:hypothetical protein